MRSASEFRQMARETLRGNWKLAMGTGLVSRFAQNVTELRAKRN